MPEELEHYTVRLKTEQHRLLDWAEIARLAESDERLGREDRGLIHDILDQKSRLLEGFGRYDQNLLKERPFIIEEDDDADSVATLVNRSSTVSGSSTASSIQKRFPSGELLEKCLRYVDRTRKYPKRLKWAAIDKHKYQDLLSKLAYFNDFMKGLFTEGQLASLSLRQIQTGHEIVQLNNKVDQLLQFFQAGYIPFKEPPTEMYMYATRRTLGSKASSKSELAAHLLDLARFKALSTSKEGDTTAGYKSVAGLFKVDDDSGDLSKTELHKNSIQLIGTTFVESQSDNRVEAVYRKSPGSDQRVWIEWKSYEPESARDEGPSDKLIQRVQRLAALLKKDRKPLGFRAPNCLGYFRKTDPDRFGFVFEKPSGIDERTEPISLLSMLQGSSAVKPSLTDRINLATTIVQSVEHLHSVNWLHKGLRSSNIVFFPSNSGELLLSQPLLAGYEYSRPYRREDWTDKPRQQAEFDIYRHPSAHGGNTQGYRKTFDLYSLGVLLIEIAFWQPIADILAIPNIKEARPSVTRNVRDRLLKTKNSTDTRDYLSEVRSSMGNRYWEATSSCLQASDLLLDDLKEHEETSPMVGEALQRAFYEKVVVILSQVSI
jgi:hypothetical protein